MLAAAKQASATSFLLQFVLKAQEAEVKMWLIIMERLQIYEESRTNTPLKLSQHYVANSPRKTVPIRTMGLFIFSGIFGAENKLAVLNVENRQ